MHTNKNTIWQPEITTCIWIKRRYCPCTCMALLVLLQLSQHAACSMWSLYFCDEALIFSSQSILHSSSNSEHLYTCLFRQLSNEPIMWLQCDAQHPADTGQDVQLMFTSNLRTIKLMWFLWIWLWFECWCQIRDFTQAGKPTKTSSEQLICAD